MMLRDYTIVLISLEVYALIKWQMGILLKQGSGTFFDQRAICSFSVNEFLPKEP